MGKDRLYFYRSGYIRSFVVADLSENSAFYADHTSGRYLSRTTVPVPVQLS